jgi:hypothetical protein
MTCINISSILTMIVINKIYLTQNSIMSLFVAIFYPPLYPFLFVETTLYQKGFLTFLISVAVHLPNVVRALHPTTDNRVQLTPARRTHIATPSYSPVPFQGTRFTFIDSNNRTQHCTCPLSCDYHHMYN